MLLISLLEPFPPQAPKHFVHREVPIQLQGHWHICIYDLRFVCFNINVFQRICHFPKNNNLLVVQYINLDSLMLRNSSNQQIDIFFINHKIQIPSSLIVMEHNANDSNFLNLFSFIQFFHQPSKKLIHSKQKENYPPKKKLQK